MRVQQHMRSFAKRTSAMALAAAVGLAGTLALAMPAAAATPDEGFALQVSPSPLVGTLTPGETSTFDIQIRNPNTKAQNLKMGLRSFTVSESSGQVQLGNKAPADVSKFVSFSSPTFTIQPGQLYTQHVIVDTPADAGFTYSFAVNIGAQNPTQAQKGASAINGSVVDFALLSVDRPGARRSVQLQQLSVTKRVYEFLPASISMKFKNSGNTLVQPQGNIFIQRHSQDKTTLATIPVNKSGGYILPGSTRTLTASWNDGFPHYASTVDSNGKTTAAGKLTWDGGDFTKLRFGRYVAKLVAVYNDGDHDVPLTAEVSFWVIPWRIIFGVLIAVLVVVVGIVTILRKSSKALLRARKHHEKPKP